MDELPSLLEDEEGNEGGPPSSKKVSTPQTASTIKQPHKKRGRPRVVKQEKGEGNNHIFSGAAT